jgi:hypothetical protein
MPPALRPPRNPPDQIASAPRDVPDPLPPPPIAELYWEPELNIELITTLEDCKNYTGWRKLNDHEYAFTSMTARALQNAEPRLSSERFSWRSTWAFLPEHAHSGGAWWCLETYAHITQEAYKHLVSARLGYPVPVLVHIFHDNNGKSDASAKRKIARMMVGRLQAPQSVQVLLMHKQRLQLQLTTSLKKHMLMS